MAFLLATGLLSETWKSAPNEEVLEWLSASVEDETRGPDRSRRDGGGDLGQARLYS